MSGGSFYVFIDSRHKITGTNSNFMSQVGEIHQDEGHSLSISLEQATFHHLQYPINNTNNVIQFQENGDTGTTYSLTIPEGVYTGEELRAELETQLNIATGNAYTYVVVLDGNTKKLTISVTIPDNFLLTSIDDIYGFTDSTNAFASAVTGASPIIIDGVQYVDLCLPGFISANITNNYNTNGIVQRIPLYGGYGSLVNYASQESDDSINIGRERLNAIRVRIRNPDGSDFQIPDNAYSSIVLRCTYEYS